MQEFEEASLDLLPVDEMDVPRIRLTLGEPVPYHQIKIGEQAYEYARSFPIKGMGAILPKYVRDQLSAGRKPLIIERPTRYLIYLDVAS